MDIEPLQLLYEAEGLAAYDLPGQLRAAYGGPLGFAEPRLVANFVTSIDGVVAIPDLPRSTRRISAASTADRFVLGLLRACADVVLIGSGTLHAHPDSLWTAPSALPAFRAAYTELRRRRKQPSVPLLAVVSASGDVDVGHPALRAEALILTGQRGADKLARRHPTATVLPVGGEATVDLPAARAVLQSRGHGLVVSEAGPHLFGSLLAADLVDELFLTTSPLLAGRDERPRPALVEGTALLPDLQRAAPLLSVRRAGSHLFLRYGLRPWISPPPAPATPHAPYATDRK